MLTLFIYNYITIKYVYLPPEAWFHLDRMELRIWLGELIIHRLALVTMSHEGTNFFIHVLPKELGSYLVIGLISTEVATCALTIINSTCM